MFTDSERTLRVKGREVRIPEKTNTLYYIHDNTMYIPIGLYSYIKDYFKDYKDYRTTSYLHNVEHIYSNINEYENILDGITLRYEQLLACRKILYSKRCIVQLATGAGKTEIMCAIVKLLSLIDNKYPTTLVIEPTSRLVDDTITRFEKYNIPVTKYNSNREIITNCVNICHPSSLGNDLDKNSDLLNSVEVMICDETHHLRSNSFRKPVYNMPNLAYSIGLSASAISQDHVGKSNIRDYTFDELLVIGSTGPLVMNVRTEHLINTDKLAQPVLLVLENQADEYIDSSDISNWHKVSKVRLESDKRTELIIESARFFSSKGRKVLILVNTVRWARDILKRLYDIGLSDISRSSYGGNMFELYDNGEYINDSNVMEKYKNGEYSILIGTSHLYEGADIPNLDVIILAYGGKGERLQIQGLGRVLRKTKTGNMAYIVDFTDTHDPILSKHSRLRLKRYRDIVGIPDDRIYYNISVSNFEDIFNKYENC